LADGMDSLQNKTLPINSGREMKRVAKTENKTVAGIPDIVVLNPVHVDIQATRVHIHVGNEELCNISSISLLFYNF